MGRSSAEMSKYVSATQAYLFNAEDDGLSSATVINYSRILNLFLEFMLNNGYSEGGPSFSVVLAWKNDLRENNVSVRSIRQYLIVLRGFFNWATDKAMEIPYYAENPVADSLMRSSRKAGKRPYAELLTDDQILLLLQNNPRKSKRPEFWDRNYAIVMMLLTTAIRNAELLMLTKADLNFESGEITIRHGKGDKFRVVQFPHIAQSAVESYLSSCSMSAGLSADEPLFGTQAAEDGHTSDSGAWHKGTTQWLTALVKRHVQAVTGVKGIGTHDLRHVSARALLLKGLSIEEIQHILGHENIATTQIYCGKLRPAKANKHAAQIFEEMEYQAKRNEILRQEKQKNLCAVG